MEILGIDIGGSALKGAPVQVESGALTKERIRIKMPERSTPDAVAECFGELVDRFQWQGPIGCTFPGVVKHGTILTAANVDKGWKGVQAQELFSGRTGLPVRVLNDADAAGVAEMQFGAGQGHMGTVIMLTFGTGIGSALFTKGVLLPNAELGHLQLNGKDAEKRASARVRSLKQLTWKAWAKRVNEYLAYVDFLFSPDLYIIGGGVSKNYHRFLHYFTSEAEIVPAKMFNDAGIVGAALAARDLEE